MFTRINSGAFYELVISNKYFLLCYSNFDKMFYSPPLFAVEVESCLYELGLASEVISAVLLLLNDRLMFVLKLRC